MIKLHFKATWHKIRFFLAGLLLGAVLVSIFGCSAMTPASKSQSMTVTALGFPAITVVSTTAQTADNAGSDTNENALSATNDVKPETTVTPMVTP